MKQKSSRIRAKDWGIKKALGMCDRESAKKNWREGEVENERNL